MAICSVNITRRSSFCYFYYGSRYACGILNTFRSFPSISVQYSFLLLLVMAPTQVYKADTLFDARCALQSTLHSHNHQGSQQVDIEYNAVWSLDWSWLMLLGLVDRVQGFEKLGLETKGLGVVDLECISCS